MNTRHMHITALLASAALATPFMPWKMVKTKADDGTEIEVVASKDGNPVWVDTNGAESTLGGDTITRLNGEAAKHRKDKETAEDRLKAFEGIDPAKARDAIALTDNIDKGKLLEAGKVEELTKTIKSEFTTQLDTEKKVNADLRKRLNNTNLKNEFATSEFVKDKLALPADVAMSYFRDNIEYDDNGVISFKYADGNPIMSKTRIGEKPDFSEAMELLVENNPNRDQLLKGSNHQGSGNGGGGGGGGNGSLKTYRRSEIDAMGKTNAAGVTAIMAEVSAGTAQLLD